MNTRIVCSEVLIFWMRFLTKEELNEAQKLVVAKVWIPLICVLCVSSVLKVWAASGRIEGSHHCAAWDWPSYMSPEALERGIKIRTSSYTRHHVNITMCKAKANGNYMNSMLALREALESGCEEALLLDNEGYVAEGSGENIFIVKEDGIIYTPELTSCLEGITRDTIIRFARELGLEVRE